MAWMDKHVKKRETHTGVFRRLRERERERAREKSEEGKITIKTMLKSRSKLTHYSSLVQPLVAAAYMCLLCLHNVRCL